MQAKIWVPGAFALASLSASALALAMRGAQTGEFACR